MSNGYTTPSYDGSYNSVPSSNAGGYRDSSFGGGGGAPYTYPTTASASANQPPAAVLRRRNVVNKSYGDGGDRSIQYRQRNVVKKLDFMFPKVDSEYTVQTDRGGIAFVVACIIIVILCLAETIAWRSQNRQTLEHVVVDTSLGKRMKVNLNITFPALSCVDVHVDVMDVAGDSQLDLDESFITKTKLSADGTVMSGEQQERDIANKHRKQQEDIVQQIQSKPLPNDYCGPCFGAQENDNQCCNTCDELIAAYRKKFWKVGDIVATAEQCIREGRQQEQQLSDLEGSKYNDALHSTITKGEGCNLVGHLTLNRVAGNFHIAMGEGIQRNGKHVHVFNPEETQNFNSSHIIHHLSFGGQEHEQPLAVGATSSAEETPLNGVTKIVDERHGTTGLFQYFIKIVPTTYVVPSSGKKKNAETRRETNGFFFTERFRPLMKEYVASLGVQDQVSGPGGKIAVEAGQSGKHAHKEHHHHDVKSNSVLPGVFFIYEIYPFAVEVRPNVVPLTHLLIRLMATIGGVFTIVQFVDNLLEKRKEQQQRYHSHRHLGNAR